MSPAEFKIKTLSYLNSITAKATSGTIVNEGIEMNIAQYIKHENARTPLQIAEAKSRFIRLTDNYDGNENIEYKIGTFEMCIGDISYVPTIACDIQRKWNSKNPTTPKTKPATPPKPIKVIHKQHVLSIF